MIRNCNLELRLVTPSCDDHTVIEEEEQQQSTKKLTIFYKGRVSSCDVTEIQARSIISVANQEIEREKEGMTTPTSSETSPDASPKPQVMQNTGLSMKRSLQHFLQKRRTRIQATSPYCTP